MRSKPLVSFCLIFFITLGSGSIIVTRYFSGSCDGPPIFVTMEQDESCTPLEGDYYLRSECLLNGYRRRSKCQFNCYFGNENCTTLDDSDTCHLMAEESFIIDCNTTIPFYSFYALTAFDNALCIAEPSSITYFPLDTNNDCMAIFGGWERLYCHSNGSVTRSQCNENCQSCSQIDAAQENCQSGVTLTCHMRVAQPSNRETYVYTAVIVGWVLFGVAVILAAIFIILYVRVKRVVLERLTDDSYVMLKN